MIENFGFGVKIPCNAINSKLICFEDPNLKIKKRFHFHFFFFCIEFFSRNKEKALKLISVFSTGKKATLKPNIWQKKAQDVQYIEHQFT
jgi:hypothetical protein